MAKEKGEPKKALLDVLKATEKVNAMIENPKINLAGFSAHSELAKTLNSLNSVSAFTGSNLGSILSGSSSKSEYDGINIGLSGIDMHHLNSFDRGLDFENQIYDLKKKLSDAYKSDKLANEKLNEIQEINKELQAKLSINHIAPRICDEAREKLFTDEKFKELFNDGISCNAVVISIDIRRSTELMLKAREPKLFSKFITQLSDLLRENIIENYGIFDKFTGDGILAFFPTFYSGDDAILRALKSANECHNIFQAHYNDSRNSFNIFIKDVGLGIGIDYGKVTLVNNGNELTVVGIPVVYACRRSGAKAGDTLFNQPAIEEIIKLSGDSIKITETDIEIKNEGLATAYKVESISDLQKLDKPNCDWTKEEISKEKNIE